MRTANGPSRAISAVYKGGDRCQALVTLGQAVTVAETELEQARTDPALAAVIQARAPMDNLNKLL